MTNETAQRNGAWLKQKLAQNGFTLEDLAAQSGLSPETIHALADDETGTNEAWDIVLGVLNDYPALFAPADSILDDLRALVRQGMGEELVDVYYGVNQSDLLFCCVKNEANGRMMGSDVEVRWLRMIPMMVTDALALFQAQSLAIANAAAQSE